MVVRIPLNVVPQPPQVSRLGATFYREKSLDKMVYELTGKSLHSYLDGFKFGEDTPYRLVSVTLSLVVSRQLAQTIIRWVGGIQSRDPILLPRVTHWVLYVIDQPNVARVVNIWNKRTIAEMGNAAYNVVISTDLDKLYYKLVNRLFCRSSKMKDQRLRSEMAYVGGLLLRVLDYPNYVMAAVDALKSVGCNPVAAFTEASEFFGGLGDGEVLRVLRNAEAMAKKRANAVTP